MRIHQIIGTSVLAGAALVALAASASASTIVDQASFEPPPFASVPDGGIQYGPDGDGSYTNPSGTAPTLGSIAAISGFTFNGYSGILSNTDAPGPGSYGVYPDYPTYYVTLPATTYGSQAAFLQDLGSNASIDWSLNNLVAGKDYTLSFYAAGGSGPYVGSDNLEVLFSGATADAAPGFISPTVGAYSLETVGFTANATSATIQFLSADTGGNNIVGLDNLVVSTVPEPASWAMMMIGFGGIGFMMRNARRKTVTA